MELIDGFKRLDIDICSPRTVQALAGKFEIVTISGDPGEADLMNLLKPITKLLPELPKGVFV